MAQNIDDLIKDDAYLQLNNEELLKSFKDLANRYTKEQQRTTKILKHSDRQQLRIITLLEELNEKHEQLNHYKNEIQELHDYDVAQQEIASTKVETNIINELQNSTLLNVKHIFIPNDILSGDFYSLFKRPDGSLFFYIIDGQGHGISPAVTVFAVSAIIAKYVKHDISFQELLDSILPYIVDVLAEEEQISFTLVEIDSNFKNLSYVNGGMYPMLIKDGDAVIKLKANSLPVLNFSRDLTAKTVELEAFQGLVVYSDGIVESDDDQMLAYSPENILLGLASTEDAIKNIPSYTRDDDITLLSITKN